MIDHFKRFTKQIFTYGLGDTISRIISILILPIFTRFLSPADFGVASLLTVTSALIFGLTDFGLTMSILRFFKSEKDLEKRKQLVATAQIAMVGITSIAIALILPFSRQISELFFKTPDYSYVVFLNFLTLPIGKIMTAPLARLRAQEKARSYVFLNLSRTIFGIVLNLILIVFLKRGLNGYFEGPLIASLVFGLFVGLYSIRVDGLNFSYKVFRKLFIFGAPLILNSISIWIINWADRFILSKLTDISTVGLYTLGYNTGMAIMLPVGAFTTAWLPFYMSIAKESNAKKIFSFVLTYYFLIIGFFVLVIAIFARDYFNFFTPVKFHPAYLVIPLITFAYSFWGAFSVISAGAVIKNKTYFIVITQLIAMSINIVGMLVLIPRYGMIGAAWATFISYLALPIVIGIFNRKLYPVSYEYQRFLQIFLIGMAIYFSTKAIYQPTVENMFLRIAIVAFYPLAFIAIGFFNKDELNGIEKIKSYFMRKK